jgi:glycosidase
VSISRRALARTLALACPAAALYGQGLSLASREARSRPDLEGASIYQVWMRAFTPDGTLQAAAKKLPHIAGLGASIVYLSPLQAASSVGGKEKGWGLPGPYGIQDYDRLDPEYGTETDLKAFTAKAHDLGLKVVMDVVLYHMAIDNPLVQRPGFAMRNSAGKLVLGNWGRPRPDFDNPAVRDYFAQNLVRWVRDDGVDGFRCDVASGVPVSFWEQARATLDKVNSKAILLAEGEMPDHQLNAFDISYNFSCLKQLQSILTAGEPAIRIRENWERQRAIWPHGARLTYSSDNHDQQRATVSFGERASWAASVLSFTMDGVPFLYNGQEIGDTTQTSYPARRPIEWSNGKKQQDLLARYRKLFQLHREKAALRSGELIWVNNSAPDSLLTFLRRSGDERILVVANLSNRQTPVTVDLPAYAYGPARDLLTGRRQSVSFSPGRVVFGEPLPAFGTMLLEYLPLQTADGPQ